VLKIAISELDTKTVLFESDLDIVQFNYETLNLFSMPDWDMESYTRPKFV